MTNQDIEYLDLMISFGGDGTILTLMHNYPNLNAPIMGVNVGRLGFMTDVTSSQIEKRLQEFMQNCIAIQNEVKFDLVQVRSLE